MIKLSNGHSFEYMAASGAFAFDGKGWPWEYPLRWLGFLDTTQFTCVIKTLTRKPRTGNLKLYKPWTCVRLIKNGAVNAVGLTNPGIEWWCKEIGPKVDGTKMSLVGSILSEDTRELAEMAKMLNPYDLVGLEINASCPNTESDLLANTEKVIEGCHAVKKASRFPIILKLSAVQDIEKIIQGVGNSVEAFSINTVPWKNVYPNKKSPLAHIGGGGVSGKAAQPFMWTCMDRIIKTSSLPVIGPSVWDFEDIATLRTRGARAISFGTIFMRYPWRPTLFVKKDMLCRSISSN